MSEPQFSKRVDARGVLVICDLDGETGAARVMAKGEQDARDRAEAQARAKLEEKRGAVE